VKSDLLSTPSLDAVEASTFGVSEVESGVILFFEDNLSSSWTVLGHDDVRRGNDNTNSGDVVSTRGGEVKSIEGLIVGRTHDGLGGKQVLEDFH
jgi:hypothetical protein